jgi:hypothetical protein
MSGTENTPTDRGSPDGLRALLRTHMATLVEFDGLQRLVGTAVVVGVVPWVLAGLLLAGEPAVEGDGRPSWGLGLRVALREMFDSPMWWLPVIAVLLFVAGRRAASSVSSDPVTRAFIVASVVWVGVLGVLLLAGNTTFGADGLWFYVRLTAYLPLVAIAAAVKTS